MDRDSSPDLLKQGVARSVRVERGLAGGDRVVKLFRSRGTLTARLGGLAGRDRSRAAREHDVLAALHARGLAVPRPLALARAEGGGWEVSMERIADAVPLSEVFDGLHPWPSEPGRLAAQLGRLLADLHAAGVRHADLHPGNVLGGARRPVAIDFHTARLVVRPERGFARAAARNLVQLVAGAREVVTPRTRARFFAAWRRALPDALRAALPDPLPWLEVAEREGRLLRRAVVRDRRRRWTRDGTACHALPGGTEFIAVDPRAAIADKTQVRRRFAEVAALAERGLGLHASPRDPSRRVRIVAGEHAEVRLGWYAAARLWEHRLPAARPLAAALGDAPWFAVEVPASASADREPSTAAVCALADALADRGVAPTTAEWDHVLVDATGKAVLAGVPDLTEHDDGARRWLAALTARGEPHA